MARRVSRWPIVGAVLVAAVVVTAYFTRRPNPAVSPHDPRASIPAHAISKTRVVLNLSAAQKVASFLGRAGIEDVEISQFRAFRERQEKGTKTDPGLWVILGEHRILYDVKKGDVVQYQNSTRAWWSVSGNWPRRAPRWTKANGPHAVRAMAHSIGLPPGARLGSFSFEHFTASSGAEEQPSGIACGAAILDRNGRRIGSLSVDLVDGGLHHFDLIRPG